MNWYVAIAGIKSCLRKQRYSVQCLNNVRNPSFGVLNFMQVEGLNVISKFHPVNTMHYTVSVVIGILKVL